MPRRPVRHKALTLEDLAVPRPPEAPTPPATPEALIAFQHAVIDALCVRLKRAEPAEAKPVEEAIRWARARFGRWVEAAGLPAAAARTAVLVATLSDRDLGEGRKPSPLVLLFASYALIEHEGMTAGQAEEALHRRYGISPSEVHKRLASAKKALVAWRTAPKAARPESLLRAGDVPLRALIRRLGFTQFKEGLLRERPPKPPARRR